MNEYSTSYQPNTEYIQNLSNSQSDGINQVRPQMGNGSNPNMRQGET
jgi:hypothetical protein